MVELSRDYIYELWEEIRNRIKSRLNKRFGRSDDIAFASYLLVYFAMREYQDLYTDKSPKGITKEEKEEIKSWAMNYLCTCHKEETIKWMIDYLSSERPIMLFNDYNNPTNGTMFYRGIQRDFTFPQDKNMSQIQYSKDFEKTIEDIRGRLKRLGSG